MTKCSFTPVQLTIYRRLGIALRVEQEGADYAEQWLEVMRCRLQPTTFAGYELCLGRAVHRRGSVPIARLTPQLIQACYAGVLADGLSPRTVFHTHAVLHRALKQAHNWGLTSGIPTELVSVPRLPYREMQALSKAQLEVLFESSRETRWYPLWVQEPTHVDQRWGLWVPKWRSGTSPRSGGAAAAENRHQHVGADVGA